MSRVVAIFLTFCTKSATILTWDVSNKYFNMNSQEQIFDIVVIGAGHAGIEAACSGARMKKKVLLVAKFLKSSIREEVVVEVNGFLKQNGIVLMPILQEEPKKFTMVMVVGK